MKKLTLLTITLMSISFNVFSCGEISDVSVSDVSEPVIAAATDVSAPVAVEEWLTIKFYFKKPAA